MDSQLEVQLVVEVGKWKIEMQVEELLEIAPS